MTQTSHVQAARLTVVAVLLTVLQTGCLGPSYVIKRAEIARLERIPANAVGSRIRVVQRFSTADTPPRAAAWDAPLPRPASPAEARQGVSPLWTQGWVAPGQPTYGAWWAAPGLRAGPVGSRGALTRSSVASRGRAPGTSGSGSAKSTSAATTGSGGDDLKAALAAAMVIGVAVGVGLAVTEGARYDGWVAVHPQHPVHLIGPNKRHRVVPLDRLRLDGMARDEEAVIVRTEGAGLWELGRAPLDREGMTYGFELGQSRIPMLNGRTANLTGGAIHVGLFANQWLGVLTGVNMAYGTFDNLAAAVLTPNVRVVAAPLHLWRLHVGAFGEWGWAAASIDAAAGALDPSGMRLAAGVLVQWEITTRLALDLRWSNRWLRRPGTVATTSFSAGLSVY